MSVKNSISLGIVEHVCNLSNWVGRAGGSPVQDYTFLHSETLLSYVGATSLRPQLQADNSLVIHFHYGKYW